jgi:hypothetical protein
VCFSSCFPFLDDIAYVVPPRTVWPPASQASSARVRWKSARFVPLGVVQAILAGRKLDENQWTVDGLSECLAPAGSPGPFRTAVRWSAAVDRLTGATERHATACLEFRPGCGLWTVASFAGEAARDRWQEPVRAAFRLLADTGFGGERSRGWGRSDPPEFVEGTLPEMILPAIRETASQAAETAPPAPAEEPPAEPTEAEASVQAQPEIAPLLVESAEPTEAVTEPESSAPAGPTDETVCPTEPHTGGAGDSACQSAPESADSVPAPLAAPTLDAEPAPEPDSPVPIGPTDETVYPTEPHTGGAGDFACQSAPESTDSAPAPEQPSPLVAPTLDAEPVPEPESPAPDLGIGEEPAGQAEAPAPPAAIPEQPSPAAPPAPGFEDALPHWLLSLFAPAPADAVDWKRGDYAVLSRGGRVESPAGSGELKKQVHMVAEGSVLFAVSAPRGSAADVAPDGFAHPVYRAGFAVAVPLPKGS